MFALLTQILLWLLIVVLVWYMLQKAVPKDYLLWLGRILILTCLVLAFFNPSDPIVGAAWLILSFPLKPLGLVLVLLFSSVSQGVKKVDGRKVVIALLVLFFCSSPWLSLEAERRMIRGSLASDNICPVPGTATTPRVGTIVVLGEGISNTYLPYGRQLDFADTSDRALAAAEQYRQQLTLGNNPLVIVSPGGPSEDARNVAANDIATQLAQLNVNNIRRDSRSRNVYQAAVEIKRILTQERPGLGNRVLLVASSIDVGRAKLTFENQGLEAIPNAVDLYAKACEPVQGTGSIGDFIPNAEALVRTTKAVDEFFSLIYYFLRGWIGII